MQDRVNPAAVQARLPDASGRPAGALRRAGLSILRWPEASIFIAGALLAAYFQSTNSAFLSLSNIENLIDYTATTSIIAAGEVMVLVCGELDLSAGMVYALSPFIMFFAISAGLPAGIAVFWRWPSGRWLASSMARSRRFSAYPRSSRRSGRCFS